MNAGERDAGAVNATAAGNKKRKCWGHNSHEAWQVIHSSCWYYFV